MPRYAVPDPATAAAGTYLAGRPMPDPLCALVPRRIGATTALLLVGVLLLPSAAAAAPLPPPLPPPLPAAPETVTAVPALPGHGDAEAAPSSPLTLPPALPDPPSTAVSAQGDGAPQEIVPPPAVPGLPAAAYGENLVASLQITVRPLTDPPDAVQPPAVAPPGPAVAVPPAKPPGGASFVKPPRNLLTAVPAVHSGVAARQPDRVAVALVLAVLVGVAAWAAVARLLAPSAQDEPAGPGCPTG